MPRSAALERLPRFVRRGWAGGAFPYIRGRRSMGEPTTRRPFGDATGILPTERWGSCQGLVTELSSNILNFPGVIVGIGERCRIGDAESDCPRRAGTPHKRPFRATPDSAAEVRRSVL